MQATQPATPRIPRGVAGAALVIAAAALWATFGLFAKRLYEADFTALELACIRSLIGWLGIAALALPRPGRLRISLRDVPFFALYGIAAFALFEFLFLLTLQRTSVAIAASLLYTAPAFVVVLSAMVLRERLPRAHWAALVLVLAGVALVTGAFSTLLAGTVAIGPAVLLSGLGAGLTYGLYTIFSKTASARYADPIMPVFWMFAFATAAMVVVEPPWDALSRPHDAWPALLGLGIVPTLLPYLLYLRALRWLRASTAAMLAAVEPVIAALLAAVFLGETLDATRIAGIALIAAAAALLAREGKQRPCEA